MRTFFRKLTTAARPLLICAKFLVALSLGMPVNSNQVLAQALPKRMTSFEGTCQHEMVSGFFPCEPKAAFIELNNGRWLLTFFAGKYNFTLAGAGDRQPNLENYYTSIDTFRMLEGQKMVAEDRGMEGECHFSLNKDASQFFFIRCDAYNRRRGTIYKFYLDPISGFKRIQ
jgi:hypothetical protein